MRYFPSKNRYFNLKLKKCKKNFEIFHPFNRGINHEVCPYDEFN
jgi:hypothetical protein